MSGRCFPDKRNRGVCFEEVRIESGDDGLGADPGAWAPLLIRDLPVFAWMPDGCPEDPPRLGGLPLRGRRASSTSCSWTRRAATAMEAAAPCACWRAAARAGSRGRLPRLRFLVAPRRVLREQTRARLRPA